MTGSPECPCSVLKREHRLPNAVTVEKPSNRQWYIIPCVLKYTYITYVCMLSYKSSYFLLMQKKLPSLECQWGCYVYTRAFISSSYARQESPILSLSWWGWGSCYESVVLGGPIYARGNHSRSRTARSALNLVRHYIVTSRAAGLNIAWYEELNGSVGYCLVASSLRLRGRLNKWCMRVLIGGVKLPAEFRGKMAAPC